MFQHVVKGGGESPSLFLIYFMEDMTEKEKQLKKIFGYLTSGNEELITLGLVMYGEFRPSYYKDVKNIKEDVAKAQINVYFKRKSHEKLSKTKL